jgi:outer membrane receptor protein involved in Fe transport
MMYRAHLGGGAQRLLFCVALFLFSSLFRSAYAVPADTSGTDSGVLAEVVVTAEKRDESLEKVPLSIVAVTSQTLEESGIQDFSQLAARIPGVVLNSAGPGRSSYSIRGIASVGGNAPTTGFYVDETPILPSGGDGANATIDPDLFDLARVEILRGPQGTLYGASSMGGTVRLITNQPNLTKAEGRVKVEGSDTQHGSGNVRLDAMYNVPLIDDVAALRVVGTYKAFSGFIDRESGVWAPNPDVPAGYPAYPVSPGTPSAVDRGVNTERLETLRVVMKIAPVQGLTITPSVWGQRLLMGGPSDYDVPTGQSGGPLIQARPFNLSEAYSDEFVLGNLTAAYDLGWGSIISNTSYMHRREKTPDDETEALEGAFPQGQFVPNVYAPIVTTRELTEEARLAFNPEGWALTGVVGAYFNNANRHYDVNYLTPNYATLFANTYTTQTLLDGVQLSDVNYSQSGDYKPKQSAVFTELNYALTSQWKLTGGVRWYDLQYTTVRHEDGWSNGGPSLSTGSAKNTGFNPKGELSYQATPDQLYYLGASKGIRPGGVNTSNLAEKGCGQDYGPYQPDSLWNYEVGGKTRWLGGALQVNAAAYYIKWKDVQQGETLPCSYQITANAGEAIVRGGELEIQAQVGMHLELGAGAGYTKAVLARDAPNLDAVAGQQLQNVPKWNGGANVKYSFEPAPGYAGFVRADEQAVGISYPDFDRTDPATFQRAYAILDMRAGVVHENWEADLFVANATDKQAALSRFISDNYDAATRSRMFTNRPRTVGLSLEMKF